jgi:hypothetical protein
MNLETSLLITAILLGVMFWLLRNFFYKRVSSGQTLFWLTGLAGGIVLALFPSLIHWLSLPWGDLWPVSWITFTSLVILTFYLLYLTIRLNRLATINELARTIARLDRRVRELEDKLPGEAPPAQRA